ncbi:MAG: purine-binding chemotaxis protein CheW, partial [candidate division Zixibacteria bacterium]|nr:purine-binding chemotaxis protein CheW [candidate division Zixibacteria bacterium]
VSQNVETAVQSKAQAGKYLTFRLSSEEYGLEILKVREIIGLMNITHVPRTPHHIRGVINLRGKVIPVLDLRLKFDMEALDDTEETCIIVVDAAGRTGTLSMGVLVDAVSEVLDIQQEEIEDAPAFGSGVDVDYILGIGKIKNSVKILLDIDKVLDTTDISMIEGMGAEPQTEEIE